MGARLPIDARGLEELFEALLAYVGDPVILARPDGTALRVNPAACKAFGRSEEEIRSLGRGGMVEPTPALTRMLEERERLGSARGELQYRRADGAASRPRSRPRSFRSRAASRSPWSCSAT
ncbi:MAG: PAS domain S-box protein [Anaeromyxobacter sp.]